MTEPILSTELTTLYCNLPDNYQRLFGKLFRYMYDYLLPVRLFTSHGGVLHNYWLVNQGREKNNLSVRELDLLTCLYLYSAGGRATIRSDRLKEQYPGFSSRTFVSLRRKGFIKRQTWDPLAPSYLNRRSHRPIFIRLTTSAISVITDIERDLRSGLYNSLRKNLTSSQ